jgi:signal transduction histidine kinase
VAPVLVVAAEATPVEPLCQQIDQLIVGLHGRCERVHPGADALAALRRERPLLIALALGAESGDGYELLSGLRQRSEFDDVPVVVLMPDDSAASDDGSQGTVAQRAYQEGASDVFGLSLASDVLAARLTAWLRLAGRAHRLWSLRDFAHEARHPIAAIGAAAHLLEVSGEDPSERQRLCSAIVSESERLGRMVEGYLDADAMLRFGDAPITELPLRLLADLLRINLTPHLRARVETRVQGELPDLAVEPDHLRQMLLNLLDNALAATTAGGSVAIEALADAEGVVLAVRDTGSGIAPENLSRIFENGFSTRGDRRRGLGLGITERLCARVGGKILVDSRLGEGTVFTLWLPRSR